MLKVMIMVQVIVMVKVTNIKTEDDAKNDNDGKGNVNEKVVMIVETTCYLEGLPNIALVALIEERGSSQVILDLQLADGVHAPGHGGPVAAGH